MGGRGEFLFEGHSQAQLIGSEMISAANLVIRTCLEKGWRSSDLDLLGAHYAHRSKNFRNKSAGTNPV